MVLKAVLLFVAALALVTMPAASLPIFLEAEDYIASYNAGGVSIYVTSCSGASGGLAVEGYDYPGDWIEMRVVLPEGGAYEDWFRSAGEDLAASDHVVTIRVEGAEDVATSGYHTVGMGVG